MTVNKQVETKVIEGAIIIIGFGSIGKGLLPLLRKHIKHSNPIPITIIAPDDSNKAVAENYSADFIKQALTQDNFESILSPYFGDDKPRGLIINVANEVGSKSLITFAANNNANYIDTVVEPWPGHYFNDSLDLATQTNFSLRENLRVLKTELTGKPTALSCCGANPGMVSWFVKRALLKLASDLNLKLETPTTKHGWGSLMKELGVKGIHIAERDTQVAAKPREPGEFVNTWSIDGFVAEGRQPAELGWGTHEKTFPPDAKRHQTGSGSAIYLTTPGLKVKLRTWTPSSGEHFGYMVTHNEVISIADYYTFTDETGQIYRPTCNYAYHPSEIALESISELLNDERNPLPSKQRLLNENEITTGFDELGVLLYGHAKGALWYGSTLDIETTRQVVDQQNATGLQVTSAIIAGIFYILDHPDEGLLETDEIDHEYCLQVQTPYLGIVDGYYTDWKPEEKNGEGHWQFSNIRIT